MMKRLFWVGCTGLPYSVGDNAQTLAIQQIINEYFSDYKLVKFSLQNAEEILEINVTPEDLILIHSGGGFGDLYLSWNTTIKKIIAAFPHVRIVQLPVSIYYGQTANFERDKIFFCDKPNFTLLCRSKKVAEFLQQNFNCHVEFYPDFTYYLKPKINAGPRKGVLFILRDDDESVLHTKIELLLKRLIWRLKPVIYRVGNITHRNIMKTLLAATKQITFSIVKSYVQSRMPDVEIKDVQVSNVPITDLNREKIVYDTLQLYGRYKLVVSDRFHALVFSSLTNTPAIGLPTLIKEKTASKQGNFNESVFRNFRRRFIDEKNPEVEEQKLVKLSNNILDVIRKRRSVRRWNDKPVSPQTVKLLLEMGYWSPTAANSQAVNLYPVSNPETVKKLCYCSSIWFRESNPKLIIVVSYDTAQAKRCRLPLNDWTGRFVWQDTAVCMTTIMLAAESLGLKSCWASVVPEEAKTIHGLLRLSKGEVVTCMLLLGYSNQKVKLDSVHQGRAIRRTKTSEIPIFYQKTG